MKCPECEMENLEGSVFCDDCGANLQHSSIAETNILIPCEVSTILNQNYEIIALLEKGVLNKYKAKDRRTNNEVLILEQEFKKRSTVNPEDEEIPRITTSLEEDPFRRVWELFRNLDHPNLIKVLDYFQENNKTYLVEELYSLESFQNKISSEEVQIDELQIITWGKALCDAVEHIHKANIIHRNITPSNILLNFENQIKLSGYERARIKEEATIDILVNQGFSPPEAFGIGKGHINETSDIFSIGATLYKLIARNKINIEQQGPNITFPGFKDIGVRSIYPDIQKVLLKAVSSDQAKRYQIIEEFRAELIKVMEIPPIKFVDKGAYVKIRGSMKTNVGRVREINQDSILTMQLTMNECCEYTQAHLFIVADGMGGVADGEVASSLAIRSVATHVARGLLDRNCTFPLDPTILQKSVEKANSEIYNYSQGEPSRKGMGSTITTGLLVGNRLIISHVGDTRAYIMNNKGIKQITEDHSLIGRLLKMGQLTPEEAKNSPQKNLIYRALGTNPQVEVELYEEQFEPGDIALICCDGLWDYFPEEELREIVTGSKDFDVATSKLIDLANERGGKDNISVIIFQLISIEN